MAERRQLQHPVGIGDRVDAVVQKLLQERQTQADKEADEAGEDDGLHPLGPNRRVGNLGGFNDVRGGMVGFFAQVEVGELIREVFVGRGSVVMLAVQSSQSKLQRSVLAEAGVCLRQRLLRKTHLGLLHRHLGLKIGDFVAQALAERAGGKRSGWRSARAAGRGAGEDRQFGHQWPARRERWG